MVKRIIKDLKKDEVLYETKKGIKYYLIKTYEDYSIKYSINKNSKIIPFKTIEAAFNDHSKKIKIDAKWYKLFNKKEYESRGCNLSVLKELLKKI